MDSRSSSLDKASQSSSLTRGQACIICRRKKMRCDGARPFCGPCSLTKKPEHCEYTDRQGRTFMEVLEERLRILKTRIRELEEQQRDEPVLLHNPYPQATGML
ncbi:uncharacterized protein FOMMEDRAFT_150594 [Fomitiporia mediterranea MF3/22]|uniref:uncharacterized protein n=1 Tax=Fomitiporia mediterranea (strain MF3/22) TaxID=694068 RepID=UPI0004407A71|nr:uncharacterized protein FOMMEDRAFT_150594 [Fomitiporia mediterranea MF3/22]EJD07974.1 hypothetical protein FOMMEDRAFT_150594 [Fomitiporia mediterranea MF3/22]